MHKIEYIEYLKSEDWKERKKLLMELGNKVCSICGSKATQLHHLKYDRLGEEELEIDVVLVCNDCHKQIHQKGEYGYEEYKSWY